MNNYYTYAYLREDGTPYYVGKGKGKRIHDRNHSVSLPPEQRRIYLKQNLTETEAFRHERYMIEIFGRINIETGILYNVTSGGQGCSANKTEEHKDKIRQSNLKTKREKHAQTYYLEHKSGISIKEYGTFRGICKKYNIDIGYACKIMIGQRKTYKGWSIKKLSQDT